MGCLGRGTGVIIGFGEICEAPGLSTVPPSTQFRSTLTSSSHGFLRVERICLVSKLMSFEDVPVEATVTVGTLTSAAGGLVSVGPDTPILEAQEAFDGALRLGIPATSHVGGSNGQVVFCHGSRSPKQRSTHRTVGLGSGGVDQAVVVPTPTLCSITSTPSPRPGSCAGQGRHKSHHRNRDLGDLQRRLRISPTRSTCRAR